MKMFELLNKNEKILQSNSSLTNEEKLIIRILLATDFSMELASFISDKPVELLRRCYNIINNQSQEIENTEDSIENNETGVEKRTYTNRKDVMDYVLNNLITSNKGLKGTSRRNNLDITLNGKEIKCRVFVSKDYSTSDDFTLSGNKDNFENLELFDYFIFVTRTKKGGYNSLLFSKKEMDNLLIKNNNTKSAVFCFKWETQGGILEVHSTPYISVSYADAELKKWKLK